MSEIPDDVFDAVRSVQPSVIAYLPHLIREKFGISSSQARRTIVQGGVRVNGAVVTDPDFEGVVRELQVGKRRFWKAEDEYDGLAAEPMDYTPIRPWPIEVTDEMVERAAVALYDAEGYARSWQEYTSSMAGRGDGFRRDARAALEAALLEPGGSDV